MSLNKLYNKETVPQLHPPSTQSALFSASCSAGLEMFLSVLLNVALLKCGGEILPYTLNILPYTQSHRKQETVSLLGSTVLQFILIQTRRAG